MKRKIKKMIRNQDFLGIIEVIRNDNNNRYGNYLYGAIPTTEEWDHVFEVFESFYDLTGAHYKVVKKENQAGRLIIYDSTEGVRRKLKWQ